MSTFDDREVVGEIEIGLPFESAGHAGAERRARVILFGVQAAVRDVVDQRVAVLAREIGCDDQFVDAVVHASLVERAVAQRARPVGQRAPERAVERGALLERPIR